MAASFGAATASSMAASVANDPSKSSAYLPLCHRRFFCGSQSDKVSFRPSARPKLSFSYKSGWNCSPVVRAQSNKVRSGISMEEIFSNVRSFVETLFEPSVVHKVAVDGSSKTAASTTVKSEGSLPEAQPQPQPPVLPPVPPSSTLTTTAPPPSPAPAPAPPKAQPSKSSHPPLKCPMAGAFYRSPAPSEPPFVKVGDKVKKGQVLCIIEAMKLMNEIEADQSGTIVEILVEDGKPVSVDTPLFVIQL